MTRTRTRSAAAIRALLLSFLVYLLPLAGRHGVWFWGLALWGEFAKGYSKREALWLAADAGQAIILQVLAFALFYRLLRRRGRLRWLVLVPSVALAVVGLNWSYQMAVPAHFLIEAETAAESGDWPVACTLPDASVARVRSGLTLALERAGEAWVLRSDPLSYGVLTLPGCRVAEIPVSFTNAGGGLTFVAPGGAALHQIFDPDGGGVSHWFLAPGAQDRLFLEPPADTKNWNPVLAADGTALAWIERERNAAGNFSSSRLRVRSLTGGDERAIPIDLPPRTPLRLLDAAGPDGPFVVSRNYGPLIGLDDRGRVAWGPLQSGDMVSAGDAIRLTAGGWVAWDSYREAERYRVAWSLPAGAGRIEVPKGRAITAVAVNPAGTLIAVSVSRHLSVGAVRDAVFVLRSADGAELYRRYLRPYARSQLAFLGDGHLALTRQDGTRSRVEVLEVPATD